MKILVTGSAGFIAGYLVEELLGQRSRSCRPRQLLEVWPRRAGFDTNPSYTRRRGRRERRRAAEGAARRLRPFRRRRGDHRRHLAVPRAGLRPAFAENERITAATFDAAIWAHRNARLRKITVVSSSMVYESTSHLSHSRGRAAPLPAAGVHLRLSEARDGVLCARRCEQYELPYTIVRPFNCIGIGEKRALCDQRDHVGQRPVGDEPRRPRPRPEGSQGTGSAPYPRRWQPSPPLHLRRRPRAGHPPGHRVDRRANDDFNLSTATSTTVHGARRDDLAQDQRRCPAAVGVATSPSNTTCSGASPPSRRHGRARIRGHDVTDEALDEIIPWIGSQIEIGRHLMSEAYGDLNSELDRLYAARFHDDERESKAQLWRVICKDFFARYVPHDACVLDLGAGYCDFVNNISARRRIAVDLNPDTARFAAPGVEVHQLPLERLSEAVEHGSADLAFASNVFEHLRSPDALLKVLAEVRTALRPGGRIMIMQPNVRLVGGAFWDFFDHTLPLSERGMTEALEVAGFRVVECRARFLPYTTKSRLPQWAFLVRLYLRFRPAQYLLGKQMLVVAERP